jgi:hypothetical protein
VSNYKYVPGGTTSQGWGIAFRENNKLRWCYGQGPNHFTYTERAARLGAFMSNNGNLDGPFTPIPIPDQTATHDFAETFDPGPVGDEMAEKYTIFRQKLLAA